MKTLVEDTVSQDSSSLDPLVGRRIGPYCIERLLGQGGTARVYLAHDAQLGRAVAIKALAPAVMLDQREVARFRREARRVAALAHPHIAPIHSVIEHDDHLYLVMPLYVESLRERLARTPRLEVDEAARVASQIGVALAAAHGVGLIHRDVKPGNILLDARGDAYLADFGAACRALSEDETLSPVTDGAARLVGTPRYMAPEQFCAERPDARSDIYALGVVFYQMLTGRTPHTGNSFAAVAFAALTEPIAPLSSLGAAVPTEVEAVIVRALSKGPADRYPTARQFVAALEDAQRASGDATTQPLAPVVRPSRPPRWPRQPVRDARVAPHRHWIPWVASVLMLLVALLGAGAFLLSGATGSRQNLAPSRVWMGAISSATHCPPPRRRPGRRRRLLRRPDRTRLPPYSRRSRPQRRQLLALPLRHHAPLPPHQLFLNRQRLTSHTPRKRHDSPRRPRPRKPL